VNAHAISEHILLRLRQGEIPEMKKDSTTVLSEIGPDLLVPPHVLSLLVDLFMGNGQQPLPLTEQLIAHLAACEYCRTAAIVLLNIAQQYHHDNNNSEEPAQDLLTRFTDINIAIEAYEYERLGAYAEAIINQGQNTADLRFPDVVAHLKTCPDCRQALKATLAFLIESEETD
jgi:hypothetical protein